MTEGRLAGARVIVTRAQPGHLAELLTAEGATVVHRPLIAIDEPTDGGAELRTALDQLATYDWLVVTSASGASRVAAAAAATEVRLAAVGTATAQALATETGRAVFVPAVQRADLLAAELVAELGDRPRRLLVAIAESAPDTLRDALTAAGHHVTRVAAYRTRTLRPAGPPPAADALLLASGSSAEGWVGAYGTATPPVVVAIGPTTAEAATRLGLKVSAVAADHSLSGLVEALCTTSVGPATISRSGDPPDRDDSDRANDDQKE